MKKMIRIGFGLGALSVAASLQAAVDISISGLKGAAWLQRYEAKSELAFDSTLRAGDRLITDETGRIEVRLGADTILQVNGNSEVTVVVDKSSSVKGRPELHLHQGRACVRYNAISEIESGLNVVVGDTLMAEISIRGDICLWRGFTLSAVRLRDGKVRISHALDRNIVVLSSIGSEYFAGDNGEFKLVSPGVDALADSGIEQPFAVDGPPVEDEADGDSAQAAATAPDLTEDPVGSAPGEPTARLDAPVEIFSVYLFSSRSPGAADGVNQRFRNAGFESQVIQISTGSEARYRVAVSGFPSRAAAQKFADSIVGRFGVSDTWIGRDTR